MNETLYGWWLPINVSANGAPIDHILSVLHWSMIIFFVGWGIFLLYCLFRFRARPGHQATSSPKHFTFPKYLVILFFSHEAAVLFFFSYPIWAKVKNQFPKEEDALVIRIVAEQFAWNIHYPGRDRKFGRISQKLIDGTNPLGLDREDPDANDDITTINDLHIPINKPVIAHLSSKDVIHSFALPVMRVKQDVIPGIDIPIWFEANKTGEFEISCAQLCGIGHYRMLGQLKIETEQDFQAWLDAEEKSLSEGGV